MPGDLVAGGAGDVPIEDGDVVGVDAQQLQRGVPVAGDVGRDRFEAQTVTDGLGHERLVLGDQHTQAPMLPRRPLSPAYRDPDTPRQRDGRLTGPCDEPRTDSTTDPPGSDHPHRRPAGRRRGHDRGPRPAVGPIRVLDGARVPGGAAVRADVAATVGVVVPAGALVTARAARAPGRGRRGAPGWRRRCSTTGIPASPASIPISSTRCAERRRPPQQRGSRSRREWLALRGVPGSAPSRGGCDVRVRRGSGPVGRHLEDIGARLGRRRGPGTGRATAWLSKHGARYGLCQIYRNEPWHDELRPSAVDHGCPRMYADPTHDPRMRR